MADGSLGEKNYVCVCLGGKKTGERPKEVMCMVCRHVVRIRNAKITEKGCEGVNVCPGWAEIQFH
jgi:hypothetical protein